MLIKPTENDGERTTFSLINIYNRNEDGTVNGTWLQDHVGTRETAADAARRTESANSHDIHVAVVSSLPGSCSQLTYWVNRVQLDVSPSEKTMMA